MRLSGQVIDRLLPAAGKFTKHSDGKSRNSLGLPSGKHTKSYGKLPCYYIMENQLFQKGHVQ
jgi:hypothetical protein